MSTVFSAVIAKFAELIVILVICISIFPLQLFVMRSSIRESMQSAIEIWKEYSDELLTMTYLKKLMGYYMVIRRKTFHFFSNL